MRLLASFLGALTVFLLISFTYQRSHETSLPQGSNVVYLNAWDSVKLPYPCENDSLRTYYDIWKALENPDDVVKLDISMQKIQKLTPRIKELKNLKCLNLAFNRMQDLPDEFAELENLKWLNLAGTRFSEFPDVVAELPNLEILDLRDHTEWPQSFFNEVTRKVPKRVKIIFDGRSYVGSKGGAR